MAKITVKNTSVSVIKVDDFDYISITDIAKYKTSEPDIVIANIILILNPSNSRGLKKRPV